MEGERKTVAALFADIKGSTELMRDLDPEEARAMVDPVLRLMVEAVHSYDRSSIVGSPRHQVAAAFTGHQTGSKSPGRSPARLRSRAGGLCPWVIGSKPRFP